jgi:hypothetical protein
MFFYSPGSQGGCIWNRRPNKKGTSILSTSFLCETIARMSMQHIIRGKSLLIHTENSFGKCDYICQNHWVAGVCPSSGKNRKMSCQEMDLFPFSDEGRKHSLTLLDYLRSTHLLSTQQGR